MHFVDEEAFHSALKSLRDNTSQTEWLLVGHAENSNEAVHLVGSGSGGYEELSANFDESSVMYGLIRVIQKIDLSTTTKFVYIYFIGEKVPALQRGKIASTASAVKSSLSPYHVDFEITNVSELSTELINQKVAETAGVVNKSMEVKHSTESSSAKKTSSYTGGFQGFQGNNAKVRASAGLTIDQSLLDAIADVRNDKTETNWALGGYLNNEVKKPIQLIAKGNGGVDEITPHLASDIIAYGLIRVVDVIEGIKTVKFVFLVHIGSDVSITKKATIATHKGGVIDGFGAIHLTVEISGEISDEILLSKVQEASGSKNKSK